MTNGAELRDFYISLWQEIPELVDAVGGDASMIRSSSGVAQQSKSLMREVESMPRPSIFVAYQGFSKGSGRGGEYTVHEIAAFIRAATPDDDAHIQFGGLMTDSIPNGQDLSVRQLAANENVMPMNMPKFERVSSSQITFDIWKLSFGVAEYWP